VSRRKIYVTESDLRRLCNVVATELALDGGSNRHLAELIAELQRAEIVASDEVPDDVVTMNSTVVLRDFAGCGSRDARRGMRGTSETVSSGNRKRLFVRSVTWERPCGWRCGWA
jgi:hypothetical protein